MTPMLEAMLHADATEQCLGLCKLSNARTYVRTHKELLTLRDHLTLGNAHRGVAKFRLLGDENSRPAALRAGLRSVNHVR